MRFPPSPQSFSDFILAHLLHAQEGDNRKFMLLARKPSKVTSTLIKAYKAHYRVQSYAATNYDITPLTLIVHLI